MECASNKIEIRSSAISGKGTFVKEKIFCNEHIITLSGELVITNDIANVGLHHGVSLDDPLQVGENCVLILNYESKTINHSCDPNAGIRHQNDLYAIRDILPGEEVTYDYATTSSINDPWLMNCGCRSALCRKKIGNVLTISPDILAKYNQLQALPDYILEQLRNIT